MIGFVHLARLPVAWGLDALGLALLVGYLLYLPLMNRWFHTAPLSARDWRVPTGIGVAIYLLVEGEKARVRWRKPRSSQRPSPSPVTR